MYYQRSKFESEVKFVKMLQNEFKCLTSIFNQIYRKIINADKTNYKRYIWVALYECV